MSAAAPSRIFRRRMSLDIDKSKQEVFIRKMPHVEEKPMSADSLVLRVAAAKGRLPCAKVGQLFWMLDNLCTTQDVHTSE